MTQLAVKKALWLIWLVFIIATLIFYTVGGEQLYYADIDTGAVVTATDDVGELTTGTDIYQTFLLDGTEINSIYLEGNDYGRTVGGIMEVSILNPEGATLFSTQVDMAQFSGDGEIEILVDPALSINNGERLTLHIYVVDGSQGSVPTLHYGSSLSLSRGEAQITLSEDEKATLNGNIIDGKLCFEILGRQALWFGSHYWILVAIAGVLLGCFSVYEWRAIRIGKATMFSKLLQMAEKYRYLLEQLVARDFKRKYKRSILGVFWSLLNPMLIMTVQYVVFSTIFKSSIENFAVYLLTGIVCYNFFSEVTNMSLTSITENASLITKVYIPKYIYPVSRALSSMVNFLLSLIPLAVVMIATRTPVTDAVLLLPFAILCEFMLSMGVGMILASSMVFFRDTQFLWSVFNMVWMYMTPIFYPEDIISGWLSYFFKINPLYHIIRFFRIILLNGVSPEPKAYLFCLILSAIPLVLGVLIFKKTQDRFVLYI